MKSLLINLILAIFLISCAIKPKYADLSCQEIRKKQNDLTISIEKIKNGKHYIRARIITSTILPFVGCLADPLSFMVDIARGYNPTEVPEIEIMKEKYNDLGKAAKWKHCSKEVDYEIITDKSHTMHFPH